MRMRCNRSRRSIGLRLILRSFAFVLALQPAMALAQDVVMGEALAVRWCANCHVVSRSATTGRADGIPSFPALADTQQTSDASLRRAMTAAHSRMPDFSLTPREQDNLIAYIFSLRKH